MKTNNLSFILVFALGLLRLSAQPASADMEETPRVGDDLREGAERNRQPKPAGPHAPHFGKIWKKADTNADGKVSFEEFSTLPRISKIEEERRKKLFARFDRDDDGFLKKEEMRAFARPMGGPPHGGHRIWKLDADRDGGVSFEEFRKGEFFAKLPEAKQREIFDRLDTDDDGKVTRKDRPQGPPPGPQGRGPGKAEPGRMIERFDGNNDGALSFEEFRAAPWVQKLDEDAQEDQFEKLDINGDKKLDANDFPPKPAAAGGPPPPPGPGMPDM